MITNSNQGVFLSTQSKFHFVVIKQVLHSSDLESPNLDLSSPDT